MKCVVGEAVRRAEASSKDRRMYSPMVRQDVASSPWVTWQKMPCNHLDMQVDHFHLALGTSAYCRKYLEKADTEADYEESSTALGADGQEHPSRKISNSYADE